MKSTSLFALAAALIAASGSLAAEEPVQRIGPYVYCNVYAADTCFGIAKGDKLAMRIYVDFVSYTLFFSFGGQALIYSGFNPKVGEKPGAAFTKCEHSNGFADCRVRGLKDGGTEFIATRDDQSASLHIVASGGKRRDTELLASFFANIRACTYQGANVTCAP